MTKLQKYWLSVLAGTLALCAYPLYMGVKVLSDMAATGTVMEENYPKYIIPYTPIALSVLVAVILLPLLVKLARRRAVLAASALSLGVFFASELLLESKVIVTTTVTTTLESWQMYMCRAPLNARYKAETTAIDILIGNYSPLFKLHFYLISVVLVMTMINCLYGFAQIIRTGDKTRRRALTVQSVCTALFLGLCVFACFTAFYRDGRVIVSAHSACLMCLFFLVLGVTVGTYAGSFWIGRRKIVSIFLPSIMASAVTHAMYFGEMILLSGHLYRFGSGILFDSIGGLVLAPIDMFVIVLSGCVNAVICYFINARRS